MHTYCRLKSGKIMVIYSDNSEKETMNLYKLEQLERLNGTVPSTIEVPYSKIDETDTDLNNLYRFVR